MYWMPNSVQWPEFFICISSVISRASLVAQRLKCLPGMRETRVRTLGREDPLEMETATPSSTLAWRIPWREEPGRLQSMGLQRVRRDFTFSLSVSSVTQSCPTLCGPMDWSLPDSSVYGILQARILEWVAISFSRGSSRPRDRTQVSHIAGRHFNLWATKEALMYTG